MHLLAYRLPVSVGSIGITALRVALGAIFVQHGYSKFVRGIDGTSGFLASLGIPMPELMAYALTYGELLGGALLILGAFTFWVSLVHVVIAAVAFGTVHMGKGFGVSTGGYEFIMLIGAGSFYFLLNGPGRYAIDTLMQRNTPDTH